VAVSHISFANPRHIELRTTLSARVSLRHVSLGALQADQTSLASTVPTISLVVPLDILLSHVLLPNFPIPPAANAFILSVGVVALSLVGDFTCGPTAPAALSKLLRAVPASSQPQEIGDCAGDGG